MNGGRLSEVLVENDFYYSVLNLNHGASQSEINERYRSLSLVFHPDKQHDEELKSIATGKFLEIQKAYEVLSDPFLREIYDVLGQKGLTAGQALELRSLPREEAKNILRRMKGDMTADLQRNGKGLSGGALIFGVDAISLFAPSLGSPDDTWVDNVIHRLEDVRMLTLGLEHKVQKPINERTEIAAAGKMVFESRRIASTLVGTVRHQFSPRFSSELSIGLIPQSLRLNGRYDVPGTNITASLYTPLAFGLRNPTLKLAVSRQLFRGRLETAAFEVDVGRRPQFAFNLVMPSVFGINSKEIGEDGTAQAPSASGLKIGTTRTSIGLSFDGLLPNIVGEWGIHFSELALQLKVGLELGFTGLAWVCSGKWSPSAVTNLSTATHVSAAGVVVRMNATYYEQELSLPIVLSTEYNLDLALYTTIIPSSAFVLGYHFIIKPRRRQHRLDSIRAARRDLEDGMGVRRERETIASLLKDTARKSKATESSKGGLVIVDATWGSAEKEDGARDLVVDVTAPLQALVHTSQVYIPADRVKTQIRGFGDPAPFAHKALNVRYLFRGKMHFAEIPEDLPVVLPLAEHLIE